MMVDDCGLYYLIVGFIIVIIHWNNYTKNVGKTIINHPKNREW